MTPEQFTVNLPPMTVDPLPAKPPFEFNGLSARVFPLRANMDVVQQLVNSYINFIPPEVGRFRASMPLVYLSILDYGQVTEKMSSLGWFAQAEIFFCVPVEWYKVVDGRWVFHDWAVITPFIYVDDRISVPIGRSIYGFSKALACLTPTMNPWTKDVLASETIARLETDVMPELYEGKRLETRTFLEVKRQQPPLSAQSLPPSYNNVFTPWRVMSNFADVMDGLSTDAMWLAQSWRIFPDSPGPLGWMQMLNKLMPALRVTDSGMQLNSLNLKQFRDSSSPDYVCYQALTNGRMLTTAMSGGGFLGAERMALGDLSGGHTIELSDYPSLPIVRKLGLQVERSWRGEGVNVSELVPVMPFWVKLNELYLKGQNLTWRQRDGIWRQRNGDPVQKPGKAPPVSMPPLFNGVVNSVFDDVAGPFRFTDTHMRVLPLKAKMSRLQSYLDEYVNNALKEPIYDGRNRINGRFRLTAWNEQQSEKASDDGYVYLTVCTIGGVKSKSNNVGNWARYDLSFLVPVLWEYGGYQDQWEVLGVGVLPAFNFVDDSAAAISRREVQGIPTVNGKFIRPEVGWMDDNLADFSRPQSLLQVQTELIPALGVGQQSQTFTIIDIISQNHPRTVEPEQHSRLKAGQYSAEQRGQMSMIGSVGRRLLQRMPVEHYTIKQFRDVEDPLRACFQSVQRLPRYIEADEQPEWINADIKVVLRDFPTLKIVDSLGIEGRLLNDADSGLAYEIEAEDPIRLYCTVDEDLGEPLLTRVGSRNWSVSREAYRSNLSEEEQIAELQAEEGSRDAAGKALSKMGPQKAIQALRASLAE